MIQMHTFSSCDLFTMCVYVLWECVSWIDFDWTYALFVCVSVFIYRCIPLLLLLLSFNSISIFVLIWIFVWLSVSCFEFVCFLLHFFHFLTKYNKIMPRALKYLSSSFFFEYLCKWFSTLERFWIQDCEWKGGRFYRNEIDTFQHQIWCYQLNDHSIYWAQLHHRLHMHTQLTPINQSSAFRCVCANEHAVQYSHNTKLLQ